MPLLRRRVVWEENKDEEEEVVSCECENRRRWRRRRMCGEDERELLLWSARWRICRLAGRQETGQDR